MKNTVQFLAFLVFAFCNSGCASTKAYFINRGNDALDIVTLTAGKGYGLGGRIGPVHAGLLSHKDEIGLAGGRFSSRWGEELGYWWEPMIPMRTPEGLLSGIDEISTYKDERAKGYKAFAAIPIPPLNFLMDPSMAKRMESSYSYSSYPWQYLTQINLGIGIGPSVRIGFNPGELLDFVVGFIGIDMYDDDKAQ